MADTRGYTNDDLMFDIFKWIKSFMKEKNFSPTTREVAEGLQLSVSTVHGYMRRLVDEGYMTMENMQARTIVPKGWHYEVD